MSFVEKGFTLIELIIVVIIIGVLAAIAGPMMQGNVDKAKKSEAIAALGAIRTAERCYYVENGEYTIVANTSWDNGNLAAYIRATDINGRYFSSNCYDVFNNSGYIAGCTPAYSGKSDSNTLGNMFMYIENGQIEGYTERQPYAPAHR